MKNALLKITVPLNWNWSDICETGIQPWTGNSNDLAPCFQLICMHTPIIILFAIVSAYKFGGQYLNNVKRNSIQNRMIFIRIFTVLLLGIVASFKILYYSVNNLYIWPIDVFLCGASLFMWLIHFGYLLSLRHNGGLNHRGSQMIIVLWLTLFALSGVWLKTSITAGYQNWPWALLNLILHVMYGLTLLPAGSAVFIQQQQRRRNLINDESRQPLLHSNAYIRFQDDLDEISLGNRYDGSGFLSKLLFNWVNPLIRKGVAGKLKKIDDLYDLPATLGILRISEIVQKRLNETTSLFKALHKCFAKEFYLIGVLRLITDLSGFAGPLLLNGLLLLNGDDENSTLPYFYTLGLFGSSMLVAICGTHFNWRITIIGMKMRIGLVTAIYEKTLEASGLHETHPEILNLMSTDTDRIVNSCISFHSFWSIPFQLFTTLYLLYTQIGAAFIAGVTFAIILIPINRWIAIKIGILSQRLMAAKDARVSVCSESLENAKQIKLLAWENIFIDKIQDLRNNEMSYLAKRKYLDALCVYFWATTPVIMCLLTFGVSVLMGNPLTAATTFTSFALLNMLIGPLNAFPWVLNGLIEAAVSLKRVQQLINLPNISLNELYSNELPDGMALNSSTQPSSSNHNRQRNNNKSIVLCMENIDFNFHLLPTIIRDDGIWRRNSTTNNDRIVNFNFNVDHLEIREGDLVCIQGPVGSGKSTFLSAILGNLSRKTGSIYLKDNDIGFGYVGQRSWLQRGTIRENILWGSGYDELYYKKVLYACALTVDLVALGGDSIGIGEGGRTLSGGQRVRVELARAVYQNKPIYLLDDILSALDGNVANHIVKYCLLDLLRTKARIIITENRALLLHANTILNIADGKVTHFDPTNVSLDDVDVDDDDELMLDDEVNDKLVELVDGVDLNTKHDDDDKNLLQMNGDDKNSLDSVMCDETKEYGKLSRKVLSSYWMAITSPIAILLVLSVILMQLTRNLSDVWLAHWVSAAANTTDDDNNTTDIDVDVVTSNSTNYYLGIYSSIAIVNSVITLFRAFIFAYGGIRAAKFIHNNLLNKVFFTKFKFFDITPLGRILNRFSSDTYTVDDSLPFILNILLAQLAGLIGSILISVYAMPWLFIIIIPMCPIYLNLQNHYRYSSRDIKRLSSNALSPLYAHFTETVQGLTTIRAMRGMTRFKRDFLVKLEESIKAQLTASAAQQWLGLRLQYIGAFLVGGSGLLAVITAAHTYNPSMVGLAISYSLSITGLLSGVLNALAETEQELVAIERINNYSNLKSEKNADGSRDPPFAWPGQGVISFENVNMKYRKHLELALIDVTFKTTTFERIGIVGRTGAGKSSLLASLLRVAPISTVAGGGGRITIDCVDIASLPIYVLRNRIAVVPQEPFLFSGTIRDNLDPQKLHLDSELWNAINNCLATSLVHALGGLNGYIKANGANLSAGQKQLLCMARAFLKNSKIVCIDEGTANLDTESEIAMQSVLRNAFKTSTVLIIAHRLKSLQKTDRIIVMENGRIIEQGSPKMLTDNKESTFSKMLAEQN